MSSKSGWLSRPHQMQRAALAHPLWLSLEHRRVEHGLERFKQVSLNELPRVASFALAHKAVRCAEQLRLRPPLVMLHARSEVRSPRQEDGRPAAPALGWPCERIDGRGHRKSIIRMMRAEPMQAS